MNIPKGHQAIMPYLILQGAAQFIAFSKKVFKAALTAEHFREDNSTIMHAEVQIDGCTIMFAESTEQYPPATGNLFVYVNSADATYQQALDNGAATVMELSNQSYGRTCGVKDPCGNVWWITSLQ